MIFNVIWTLFLFRGAVIAHELANGEDGYGKAAFVSYAARQGAAGLDDTLIGHRSAAAHRRSCWCSWWRS